MNTLQTERLTLMPQCAMHAEAMFAVLADPAIYAHENEPPASVEWLRARFARLESRQSPDGRQRWLNWVLSETANDSLIGFVQATVLADGAAYVAYVLGSPHWGRGLASEATAAVLDELAATHHVREFLAVLKRVNLRSLRLLERHGFAPATPAALAAHPVESDELLMVLTHAERTIWPTSAAVSVSPSGPAHSIAVGVTNIVAGRSTAQVADARGEFAAVCAEVERVGRIWGGHRPVA